MFFFFRRMSMVVDFHVGGELMILILYMRDNNMVVFIILQVVRTVKGYFENLLKSFFNYETDCIRTAT